MGASRLEYWDTTLLLSDLHLSGHACGTSHLCMSGTHTTAVYVW
jgi:hypothetical protein